MRRSVLLSALAIVALSASPAAARKKPQLTPMEIQALQTKEFETTKEILFASVVSVFQDLGYQLENADMGSGFITASSATTNKTSFWDALAKQNASGNSRVTAFVEQMPSGTSRVRLNFLNTRMTSGMYGDSKSDKPVLDPKTYQIAWEKIDEAIFVRGATTDSSKAASTSVLPEAQPAAAKTAVEPN